MSAKEEGVQTITITVSITVTITVSQVCNAQRKNVKFLTQIMLPYLCVFSSDCQQALTQSC